MDKKRIVGKDFNLNIYMYIFEATKNVSSSRIVDKKRIVDKDFNLNIYIYLKQLEMIQKFCTFTSFLAYLAWYS